MTGALPKLAIAQGVCLKCGGSRVVPYDENHAAACDECCPHVSTYRQGEGHQNPGALTCAMCGKEIDV